MEVKASLEKEIISYIIGNDDFLNRFLDVACDGKDYKMFAERHAKLVKVIHKLHEGREGKSLIVNKANISFYGREWGMLDSCDFDVLNTIPDRTFIMPDEFEERLLFFCELYEKRCLYRNLMAGLELFKLPEASFDDLCEHFYCILDKTKTSRQQDPLTYCNLSRVYEEKCNSLGVITKHGNLVRQISSGYDLLDKLVTGFDYGDFIIIGARPGMGKTALAINLFLKTVENDIPAIFFSLEMSKWQFVCRALSIQTDVDSSLILCNRYGEGQAKLIEKAKEGMAQYKWACFDEPHLTTSILKRRIREYIRKMGVKVVFIDYLGLLHASKGTASKSKNEQVTEISRELKLIASELEIVIISLCQLNRGNKDFEEEITMKSLRDSGSIEQDADMVFLLKKDKHSVYVGKPNVDEIILNVAKNRHGRVGNVKFLFNKSSMKFEEYTQTEEEPW